MKRRQGFLVVFSIVLIVIGQLLFFTGCGNGKKQVIVDNVDELIDAVADANANGGNVDILLRDGTYDLTRIYERKEYNCLWIEAPNVTFRGMSGDRDAVIVQGDAMAADAKIGFIFNVAGKGFTCENMTLRNVGNHLIQIHGELDVDDPVIRNVRFLDSYEQMIKITGDENVYSDNGLVENCLFEYSAGIAPGWYTCAIDGHRCRNWTVDNVTVRHIVSPDDELTEPAIHFWVGSLGITVKNCTITNCERGIYFGMDSETVSGGQIIGNHVDTMRDVSIGIENAPETLIENNTCITRNYPNSIEYRWLRTRDVRIIDNKTTGEIIARDNASAAEVSGNTTIPIP